MTQFPNRTLVKAQQATLCFLIKKDKTLLALKKRGFGKGKWNGVGGKVDEGEFLETAAKRESIEEIGVNPKNLKKVALLHFYFPDDPDKKDWNQDVHVYFADRWIGEPKESDEMKPKWFSLNKIPYKKMWDDDSLWLPKVLKGEKVECWFSFDDNNKVVEYKISRL